MYKIAYWGYSEKLLSELIKSTFFELKHVITVRSRVNDVYLKLLEESKLPHTFIQSKAELLNLLDSESNYDCILMYKFEFIIPQFFVLKNRIVNFHGGNLRTNRGAHAVVRSILNRDEETRLSLYELTGGIDESLLIAEYPVKISETDTTVSLNQKLAVGIPQLLVSLKEHLDGNLPGSLVEGGVYFPRITEEDYTIYLSTDSLANISAKIRSQEGYDGAILHYLGKVYHVKALLSPNEMSPSEYDVLQIDRKGEILRFCVKQK